VRKYFIDNGYLEAVIALPERLFETTNIATTMVVLSKGNERTMLVDATSICEKGRRYNSFTEEQVEQISFSVAHETINSRFMTREELVENEYVINPTRYLTEEIVVENGVPFENIIKSITRGAPLKASQLDEMVSDEPTDYQYLMLANIQRGQIDSTLPYIKGIQDNQRKYCLKNHDLILSKNGAPFKIAVAEVQPGKTILANGNLYIIEIDEEKADPFFVKAFLESEKGAALLKSITVGAAIPNIGVEALKKLPIPNVPLEEQHELATKYLAKVDEITLYQRKLKKAYEELAHIYDSKE
jgi:type I restriction enzyme M protein